MTADRSAERFKTAKELVPEAYKEALKRYPTDVEGALIFFTNAIGLTAVEPTEDDIAWAQSEVKHVDSETGIAYV